MPMLIGQGWTSNRTPRYTSARSHQHDSEIPGNPSKPTKLKAEEVITFVAHDYTPPEEAYV
jgi:hypothetical protein